MSEEKTIEQLRTTILDMSEAMEALILFSKHTKSNAVALSNAYRALDKARGEIK